LSVQKQLCKDSAQKGENQELIHIVSTFCSQRVWVNIRWKTRVRLQRNSTLMATAPDLLIKKKPRQLKSISQEQIDRMEREMTNLQGQYKTAEQTYGDDMLNLVLARGYLVKLLENARVGRFLIQHQPEVMEQFNNLVQTTSLEL
ncbi:plasmid partitioning protein RepB C-terminal domain-containing protein, partial [Polaromonas sp. YR568]|uniref:plasmid partitioning protein RepB C-terminal domain-containing protein n=1 Tax=Polaromonas sp. YR568 TaxID=1855301 RepID=UPI00398C2081